MKVQFALCAQSASVDRSSNRLSIFNVLDQFPTSTLPIVIPAITFVSVIDSDKEESSNVKGVLEVIANNSSLVKIDIPINFANGRLARVIVNFSGIPIRESGPVVFRLTIPEGVTAETAFQVTNLAQPQAIQVATPSAQS
jgi:hypothetical protein